MRIVLATLLMTALLGCKHDDATAPADPKKELLNSSTAIANGFVARAKAHGLSPTNTLTVTIQTLPQLSVYSSGVIYVPYWPEVDQATRTLFNRWAGYAGNGATGEGLFRNLFNSFLLAHEATHYMQEVLGRSGTRFNTEQEANDFAVAFWLAQPNGPNMLSALTQQIRPILAQLPQPYPQGADPRAYFNNNYQALMQDPSAYGYYQFSMILDSHEYITQNDLTFDGMVGSIVQ